MQDEDIMWQKTLEFCRNYDERLWKYGDTDWFKEWIELAKRGQELNRH